MAEKAGYRQGACRSGAGRRMGYLVILMLLAGFVSSAQAQAIRIVPESREEIRLSFAPLVKQAAPAVVNIYTRKLVQTRSSPLFDDPFFRRFFGREFPFGQKRQKVQNALGSGVIVRANGLIVTNNHVIAGADSIRVVLNDKREYDARVVLADEKTDLAVLRIDTKGRRLPVLRFAAMDDLQVGDVVIAIGNPFGVGQTVTMGIISALSRSNVFRGGVQSFIQTDAAINPGNSGGALLTLDGKLAGINTAIFSKSGGSIGIGFAIPADLVASVVRSAEQGGKVVRPWFGASGQSVTPDLAEGLGLKRPVGVLLSDIYPGGPADKAGLRSGDVVVEINGHAVQEPNDLRFRIATLAVGGYADLVYYRDGRKRKTRIALRAAPEIPPRNDTRISGRNPLEGAVAANLSPAVTQELELPYGQKGVILLEIARGSTAARLGFRPGDIVLELNGTRIDRVDTLLTALRRAQGNWRFRIQRKGRILRRSFRS